MHREWTSVPGVRPADVQIGPRSRCMCSAMRLFSAAMRFWCCSRFWRCSGVWTCSGAWSCSCSCAWTCPGAWTFSGAAQPTTTTTVSKATVQHLHLDLPTHIVCLSSMRFSRKAAAFDGDGDGMAASAQGHRSMAYRSNYCAVGRQPTCTLGLVIPMRASALRCRANHIPAHEAQARPNA